MSYRCPAFSPCFAPMTKVENMDTSSVSKNLIYQRSRKGYTQEALADRASVTVRTIQRIEKGEVSPHLQTVKLLAVALEVEIEDLVDLDDPKQESIQQKWLLLLHATPVLGAVLPLANILIPLFLWIHKREDNVLYDEHGRAVVNFQISITIFFLLGFLALLTVKGIGFFLFIGVILYLPLIVAVNIVLVVRRQSYFYPLAIPFLPRKRTNRVSGWATLLISAFSLGATATASAQPIARLDGTTIDREALIDRIETLMTAAEVPGLAIAVFNDNQVVFQETFGYRNLAVRAPLEAHTNIYGASLSKAVFAVLVMQLVEEGVIDLDTPLESYLPKKIYAYEPRTRWHDDYSALKNDTLYHRITARMCLAHTSGFPNWRWFEPDQQLKVKFAPGSRYHYSGEGLVYLQVVLEKLTGRGLEALAREKIFEPLGMEQSSYQWQARFADNVALGHRSSGATYPKDTDNEPRSASTLETTLADYGRFMEAVLQEELLRSDSWTEMFTPQIRIRSIRQFGPLSLRDSTGNDAIQLSYGFGSGVFQSPYGKGISKGGHGDGFQHYSVLFPEAGKGLLIMSNSDNAEGIYQYLLEAALADTYTPLEWKGHVPFDAR